MTLQTSSPSFFEQYIMYKESRRLLLEKQVTSQPNKPQKKKNISPLLTYGQNLTNFHQKNLEHTADGNQTGSAATCKAGSAATCKAGKNQHKYKVELLKNMCVKSKFVFKKINKKYNKRHLSTYLARRLCINREYNYRVKRTLLITGVYNDSVNTTKYGTLDQFNVGLMMYLAFHTS